MTLVLDSIAVAEGATTDARGNLTLVAYNPNVIVVESFPSQVSPVVVAVAEDRDCENPQFELGDSAVVRFNIVGPDGDTVFFAENSHVANEFPHDGLPRRLQALVQVPFTANKAGDYTFHFRLSIAAKSVQLDASRTLRISQHPSGALD